MAPSSVWFRSSGLGGNQFTKALVREFQLSTAQAEELKPYPARAESLHRMYKALGPALEKLAAGARSLLDEFAAGHAVQRIERVLGCGGSFQLHGLLRYLRSGFSKESGVGSQEWGVRSGEWGVSSQEWEWGESQVPLPTPHS